MPGYEIKSDRISFYGIKDFDIEKTFVCGQCFRFDPSVKGGYEGVAGGKYGRIVKAGEEEYDLFTSDLTSAEYWNHFLAFDTDYVSINEELMASQYDIVRKACSFGRGIRILKQDEWEAVCSFIISQNNNIPRIKKIISRICEKYGDEIQAEGKTVYSFPAPQKLYEAGVEELFGCGTGFRAKYIYSAAKMFATGELDTESLKALNDEELINALMSIKGVGLKVASCASLYGFARLSSFPIDVWMKKIIDKYFDGEVDIPSLGKYAGIAQQYLFYFERNI